MGFQIPTDNLYKFMAIIGALICCISFVVPDIYEYKLVQMRHQVMKENADLIADGHIVIGRIQRAQSELNLKRSYIDLLNERIKLEGCKPNGFDLCGLWKSTNDSYLSQQQDLNKFNDAATKWTASVEKAKSDSFVPTFIQSKMKKIEYTSAVLTRFGVAITVLGFVMWYLKLQRYMDRALKSNWSNRDTSI